MDKSALAKIKKKAHLYLDEEFFFSLPSSPAVYRIWGEGETLLYIGKAKNLRRRLLQYKNAKRYRRHKKMRELVSLARRITWQVCSTHLDACILEVELIQKLRPPYNISAKFSFLYPMIGIRFSAEKLDLIFTTHPDRFSGVEFFGAYRSRKFAKEAYFSLTQILKLLLIPRTGQSTLKVEHSFQASFSGAENRLVDLLKLFLNGTKPELLDTLFLCLLEKRGARKRAIEVHEALRVLKRFYQREIRSLSQLIQNTGYRGYPVPQEMRDILFVKDSLQRSCKMGS